MRLEKIEVFPLLPFAYLEVEARDFGFLDRAVVIDEPLAEALAERFGIRVALTVNGVIGISGILALAFWWRSRR